jgi:hypothetical protein
VGAKDLGKYNIKVPPSPSGQLAGGGSRYVCGLTLVEDGAPVRNIVGEVGVLSREEVVRQRVNKRCTSIMELSTAFSTHVDKMRPLCG